MSPRGAIPLEQAVARRLVVIQGDAGSGKTAFLLRLALELIENMNKRKPVGRTARGLAALFSALPEARFCFDIGHARQVGPSMTEAALLLEAFGHRLAEIHTSEVNAASRHDSISHWAVLAFAPVLASADPGVPVILESMVDQGQSDIETEIARANEVFAAVAA